MAESLLEPFKIVAAALYWLFENEVCKQYREKLTVDTGWMCVCPVSSRVKCACEAEPFKESLKQLKNGEGEREDSAVEGQRRRRRRGREERGGRQEAERFNEKQQQGG